MGADRMARKKKETRKKIINVAMGLIQKHGFDNTTMEQIAEETDIARKTLYNHFPVKEAIVDEYVKDISKGLAQKNFETVQSMPDTRSRLLAFLSNVYEWVDINPEITRICLGYRFKKICQGSGYSDGETGTQRMMAEIVMQGQQAGEIRQDIPMKLLVTQLDILRGTIVSDWLSGASQLELSQGISKIVDLFMDGAIDREGK